MDSSWRSYAFILLGFWLLATGFPIFYSDLISGTLLIILGLKNRKKANASILWSIALIGIWLELAPLLFWTPHASIYINDTLVGALVITFSIILYPMPGQVPDIDPTIPPGWSYNPSSWPQRLPIAFLGFVCWMISKYLCAYQLGFIDSVWDPFFASEKVLNSEISKAFPISDAGLGAFGYTLEFFSVCQGGKARWRTSPFGVLLFGMLVIPLGIVSTILVMLQPLVVGSWCTLCLLSAICMLLPIPLASDEVIATLQYLKKHRSLLFKGGTCSQALDDKRTPPLNASFLTLIKASLWGVSIPWNLAASIFLGIFLMFLPSFTTRIIGPLLIVSSIVALSEPLRKIRYVNLLFALTLLLFSFTNIFHIAIAIVIALLALQKGPIHETYHSL